MSTLPSLKRILHPILSAIPLLHFFLRKGWILNTFRSSLVTAPLSLLKSTYIPLQKKSERFLKRSTRVRNCISLRTLRHLFNYLKSYPLFHPHQPLRPCPNPHRQAWIPSVLL